MYLHILVILFIVGFIIKIYFESEMFHLKCIVSDEDGNTYCVRETPKLELVADLLATYYRKIRTTCSLRMKEKYPNRENVQTNG